MNDVRDFGAAGDGMTLDTAAIQKAIDLGGIVNFPPGRYLTGTLYLKSNGGINLEPGAVLLADEALKHTLSEISYPDPEKHFDGGHLLIADNCENITISGPGIIDGNSGAFFDAALRDGKRPEFYKSTSERPAQLLYIRNCRGVTIGNITFINSPSWCCLLHGCDYATLHGIRILNDQAVPQADGIAIDCCSNVTVSDCIIDSGGDCLTLRSVRSGCASGKECSWVTVSNCIFNTPCWAIRVGAGDGVIRDCKFADLIIRESAVGVGICPCWNGQYAEISNIAFDNLRFSGGALFRITADWLGNFDDPGAKSVRDVSFRHIRAEVTHPSLVLGNRKMPLERFKFYDIETVIVNEDFCTLPWDAALEDMWRQRTAPAAMLLARHNELEMRNLRFRWCAPERHCDYGVIIRDSRDTRMSNCYFERRSMSNGQEI